MFKYLILVLVFLICFIFLFSILKANNKTKKLNYRDQIQSIYDKNLKNWPVPYKTVLAETRYGKTHVIISGPEKGFPVILLHPFGFNGTIWSTTVQELNKTYKTYCLDTIGDLGRSILKSDKDYPRNAEQYCDWLEDIFYYFKIEKAHLVGLSMGGWIANAMGLYKPSYVYKLVLCAPAAGIPEKIEWGEFLKNMILFPTEKNLKKMVRFILGDGHAYDKWSDYFFAAVHLRDAKVTPPFPFSDELLKTLSVPTILMVGDKEVVWTSIEGTLERGKRLIPTLRTVIITDAGHALVVDQPESVNKEILKFLNQNP